MEATRVILIAGPAGSGKSSTAARIAQQPGWAHVSEDTYWDAVKEGHPAGEFRTEAEQAIVQGRVIARIEELAKHGVNVALEFILYEDPPVPLLYYQEAMSSQGMHYSTVILRPSVDAILSRINARGRSNDVDMERNRANAEHQIAVLHSQHIKEEWVIDSTDLSLEQVAKEALLKTN